MWEAHLITRLDQKPHLIMLGEEADEHHCEQVLAEDCQGRPSWRWSGVSTGSLGDDSKKKGILKKENLQLHLSSS